MSKSPPRNHSNSQVRKKADRPHSGKELPRLSKDPPRREGPRFAPRSGSGEGWIWGQHPVEAALANPARQLKRLVCTRNALSRLPAAAAARIEDLAPGEIDALLPLGAVHQGIAAQFAPLPELPLDTLIARGIDRLVILDQVSDPHNLGAIFRSAAAFGFGGLILQSRNAPPISGVVAKAAVGAIETVAECRVVNIARTLEQLAEAGYHTVGLAGEGRNTIDLAVRNAPKIAVVLGAEGAGLRPMVAKACAELARIPISGAMESLNVSNAAAIAFYETARHMPPIK